MNRTAISELENAARLALGHPDGESEDPLPPGPTYGPFGYFRLAILIFAAFLLALIVFTVL